MSFYFTTIIVLIFLFEKITFSFLEKICFVLILLDFYRAVKTVVSFKVVMTKTLCYQLHTATRTQRDKQTEYSGKTVRSPRN